MAAKRMFSIDVVDTDKFLDMPVSTQALYFHFGMRADDDGFVASPRKIVKIANCTNDDLKVLISKGYVIPFQSGVIVITDWKTNNFIRSDRYKASASSIRCLYQIAFSGRLLPKQKPEQHKDSTLVMLQHIEDPEAWEKIYKLVNVLWLKEATYRTVELEKGVKKA